MRRDDTSKSSKLIPIGDTQVAFKETVLVYLLPAKNSYEQWLARFGIWKEAPFHDELWDGYQDGFRPKPLTKRQLAKANKEYKWRRRLPPRIHKAVFQRGKQGKKLCFARDEVEIYEERIKTLITANKKVVEDLVHEENRATIDARAKKIKAEVSFETLDSGNNLDSDTEVISIVDSQGEHLVESVPRGHKLQNILRQDTIMSVSSMYNPVLKREKSQVLSAYDKYEEEVSRRKGSINSRRSKNASRIEEETIVFEVDGKKIAVASPIPVARVYEEDKFSVSSIGKDEEEILSEVESRAENLTQDEHIIEERAGLGSLVWALGQAVSSYLFSPQKTDNTVEDESDGDTIDRLSSLDDEVEAECRRTMEEFVTKGSRGSDKSAKAEVMEYLESTRKRKPEDDL